MSRILKKKLMVFFLTGMMVFFIFTLMGCKKIRENEESKRTEDIVILYTNDIHASITKYRHGWVLQHISKKKKQIRLM